MRALASIARELELGSALKIGKGEEAVSYTHLTLPTSDLV